MIGLVLVSHSPLLAAGVRDLLEQMAPDVTVGLAGGTDDDEIGTSFDKITTAVELAEQGDGAIVLYDLGSAQLTAEMVIEMLDEDRAARVRLLDLPFVEGALAAATAISPSASLDSVVAAATSGAGWGDTAEASPGTGDQAPPEYAEASKSPEFQRQWTLQNPQGLHARPAAAIVRCLAELDANVQVAVGERRADARSMLSLVALASVGGDEVTAQASGPDAEAALDRIGNMIQDGFGGAVGRQSGDETQPA